MAYKLIQPTTTEKEQFIRWYEDSVETIIHPVAYTILSDTYYDYHLWAQEHGLTPMSPRRFMLLFENTFPPNKIAQVQVWGKRCTRLYKGLRLTTSANGKMDWSTELDPMNLNRALAQVN